MADKSQEAYGDIEPVIEEVRVGQGLPQQFNDAWLGGAGVLVLVVEESLVGSQRIHVYHLIGQLEKNMYVLDEKWSV